MFARVLIANRGEIARARRSARCAGSASRRSPSTPTPTPTRRTSRDGRSHGASRSRPTSTIDARGRARRAAAPRRCTPATASSPRTRRSRGRAPRPGSTFVGPPPEAMRADGRQARAPRRRPPRPGCRWCPSFTRGRGARARGAGDGATRCWSRRPPAAADAACASCSAPEDLRRGAGRRAPRGAGRVRRRPRAHRALPRARAPPRGPGDRRRATAACCTSASASARCSAATRR